MHVQTSHLQLNAATKKNVDIQYSQFTYDIDMLCYVFYKILDKRCRFFCLLKYDTFLKTSDGGKAICLARHLWRRRRKKRMELRYCDTAFRSPTQQRKISIVPPDNKQTHPFHPNFSYSSFIVYVLVKPNP